MSSFDLYWKGYGGFKKILSSFYFWYSILFSLIVVLCGDLKEWYNLPISILPNLLGFSIGAYAILLALGDSKFWEVLAKKKKDEHEPTPFIIINSSFVHFIFIQVFAIIFGLLSKLLAPNYTIFIESPYVAFIGLFLVFYAILTALASTLVILRLSKWYQDYLNSKDNKA